VLFGITKHGLVPAEIRAVLAYIRSRWPAEVLERRAEMLRNRR
jgi:hypothetical protein